MVILKQYI